jgi:hypothetical protein
LEVSNPWGCNQIKVIRSGLSIEIHGDLRTALDFRNPLDVFPWLLEVFARGIPEEAEPKMRHGSQICLIFSLENIWVS